ncbi:HPr family phosphocarrier protein [uncultured Allobaculum sp.]|uniref:HPr family phosphocarrier protein n=1 Tax=uncultured Allobaculum sp. TaxID=1187017 RepID=UPI0025859409|nr:HPr family phosphocarrier protein [uncultured Allobaculum sp.]
MKQATVKVIDPVGLHARPATVAVNAASGCKSDVVLNFKGRESNMKSIMGVMSLGIPTQAEIVISATGDDEDEAIDNIVKALRAQKVIE